MSGGSGPHRIMGRPREYALIICAMALVSTSCGHKPRRPIAPLPTRTKPTPASSSRSATADTSASQTPRLESDRRPIAAGFRIRVLLKQRFSEVRIENCARAPLLQVRAGSGRIRLSYTSGKKLRQEVGSGFRLTPRSGQLLKLDGTVFRGALEAFVNPVGEAVVVNDLPIEEYLKGVVANELNPRAFPEPEAIKAQVIAARTFSVSRKGTYASRGFDVFDDFRSQMYRGVASEDLLSNRAVDDTRGEVAVFHHQPILALYSSTCGGLTASYHNIFQRPGIPYLKGGVRCPDEGSRYHSWEMTLNTSDIQSSLDRYARVGKLRRLVVLHRSQWGRVVEMLFEGTKGRRILRGGDIRFALGVRSNWILGIRERKDSAGDIVRLRVRGRGWGHGVGLCQMGSVELAREGYSAGRIVKHYYPGVQIVREY